MHVLALHAARTSGDTIATLRVKFEVCVIAAICWIVWALSGGGYLWRVWPMLGMGTALAARARYVHRNRLPWVRRRSPSASTC